MNELTKSILWRVRWIVDTSEDVVECISISEEEFKALSWDMNSWAKTYNLAIDGVPIKIKWNERDPCRTT